LEREGEDGKGKEEEKKENCTFVPFSFFSFIFLESSPPQISHHGKGAYIFIQLNTDLVCLNPWRIGIGTGTGFGLNLN